MQVVSSEHERCTTYFGKPKVASILKAESIRSPKTQAPDRRNKTLVLGKLAIHYGEEKKV